MKWFSARYTYPVITLVIVTAIVLQVAWLSQIYRNQRHLAEEEIEQLVNHASVKAMYLNIAPESKVNNSGYRDFFLSPQWLNFKQGFDDITDQEPYHHVNSAFGFVDSPDSALVNIRLTVFRDSSTMHSIKALPKIHHRAPAAVRLSRLRRSVGMMDSIVHQYLHQAGITAGTYYILHGYEPGEESPGTSGKHKPTGKSVFSTRKYSISFRDAYKYQLVVPQMTLLVLSRMRYYLISAVVMVLLTVLVFYFIIRLIKQQRFYDTARTAFISNMSHELKSPVAIIDVALDAILRYQLVDQPQKLENYIKVSQRELQRLKFMVENVLSLEEMDKGQIKLRPELYDVQQGLAQVITSMRLQNKGEEVRIAYFPSDEPCFVNGDPVHLPNIFYNLIDNAIKYGGSNVSLRVTSSIINGQVVISFADNGPGIDKAYHTKVFERFFRIQPEGEIHNVKGHGLGLGYVKQLLEKHNGTIHLHSEINKGSTFTIYLPLYHEI